MPSMLEHTSANSGRKERCGWLIYILTLVSALTYLAMPGNAMAASDLDISHLIFEPVLLTDTALSTAPPTPGISTVTQEGDYTDAPLTTATTPDQIEELINATIEGEGLFSVSLREQYETLGLLHQHLGNHEKAIEHFQQAMQITRVNNGLFSLYQQENINRAFNSNLQMNAFNAADDLREYEYFLALKNHEENDLALRSAKEKLADWKVDYYLRSEATNEVDGSTTFSTSSSMGYVPVRNQRTGEVLFLPSSQLYNAINAPFPNQSLGSSAFALTPDQIVDKRLLTASDLYESLLESDTSAPDSVEHIALVDKLANVNYTQKQQLDNLMGDMTANSMNFSRNAGTQPILSTLRSGYTSTKNALEEIVETTTSNPLATPLEKANAIIALADWNLAFDHNPLATTLYEQAWELLHTADFSDEAIIRILNPSPVIAVPAKSTHPYTRKFFSVEPDILLTYRGHIDTNLSIDRFGRIRKLAITDTSEETPRLIRSAFLNYYRKATVRPFVSSGKVSTTEQLSVRFFYTY